MNSATPRDYTHDQPHLVLLAGLLCDRTIWEDVAARISDLVSISIIDFAGFSTIEAMAEHVLGTAPQRFVLVGHSMGGRVALEVMRRAPGRVRGLGLFNTGVHPPASHEPASRGELVQLAHDVGMRKLADRWLPPMLDAYGSTSESLRSRLTAMVERASPAGFAKQIAALLNRPDAASVLPSIHIPTLLVSATGDRWSPIAQHEEIRRSIPHADLAVIQSAGHMAPIEQPDAVAAALRDWIAGLGNESVDEVERLAIELSVTRQIHRYARLNDAGDFETLARMYTDHGVLARPSEPNIHIRGRDSILASMRARPLRISRHVMTGIEITVDSSARARAHSIVLLFSGEGSTLPATINATFVGTFDDVLRTINGEWQFVQRLGALQLKHNESER